MYNITFQGLLKTPINTNKNNLFIDINRANVKQQSTVSRAFVIIKKLKKQNNNIMSWTQNRTV